jgi:HlyD family secretion protein
MHKVLKFKGTEDTAAGPLPSAMDRPIRPRRFRPALLALAAVVAVAVSAGLFAYVKYGLVRSVTVSAERLAISEVRTGLFRDYVPETGTIAPRETVLLDTLEGGQVVEILVDEGEMVAAGQPLALLNNRRLELDVIGREAQFTEQQNQLATLQLSFNQNELQHRRAVEDADYQLARVEAEIRRYGPLVERGFYPRGQFEDLQRELAYYQGLRETRLEAQAADQLRFEQQITDLRAANTRQTEAMGLIREGLENLTVTSPIAGQLTVFDVQPGQTIGAGQSIGQVDMIDSYKVTVQVDEFYLGRIVTGQPAVAMIGGAEHPMTVDKVYPDVRERRFEVDLEFDAAAPESVRPGQSVQLRIELGEAPDSLIVDNGAFYEDTGGTWVFVLSPDGSTAERRDVRLGRRNPEAVEVLSGLTAGERIITSSYQPYREVERIHVAGAARSNASSEEGN